MLLNPGERVCPEKLHPCLEEQKLAGDQSISLLKDEPPGAYAYGWVFGRLVPGNVFLVSFYMKAFSAEAAIYIIPVFKEHHSAARLLTPNQSSGALLLPSHLHAVPTKESAYMPKKQLFALHHLSEETELNLAVKFILVREKVSLTGYNRNMLSSSIWIGPSEVPCGFYLCHHLIR